MATSQETFDAIKEVSVAIGKEPVEVAEPVSQVANEELENKNVDTGFGLDRLLLFLNFQIFS